MIGSNQAAGRARIGPLAFAERLVILSRNERESAEDFERRLNLWSASQGDYDEAANGRRFVIIGG